MNITFIGGGNMATALIKGLVHAEGNNGFIHVCDPSEEARQRLEGFEGVTLFASSRDAIIGAQVIVLAVKPQIMHLVLEDLSGLVGNGQLVVSVAAGITLRTLRQALGETIPLIRSMPNAPALLGQGITGLYADPGCSEQDRETAERILRKVGEVVWVDQESLMDVITAISGSGPAYFFFLTEALQKAGIDLGLEPGVASKLAIYTAHGAGSMAINSEADISELRRRVTSKGGTTQAALETLVEGGFEELVFRAIRAATNRGRELSGAGETL